MVREAGVRQFNGVDNVDPGGRAICVFSTSQIQGDGVENRRAFVDTSTERKDASIWSELYDWMSQSPAESTVECKGNNWKLLQILALSRFNVLDRQVWSRVSALC